MIEKLIRCTQCNRVIPRFGSFGDFGESSSLPGVEWSSEDLEEQREFYRRHQSHSLEDLFIDAETLISDRPFLEARKVAYMEATNGQQRFLVKRTKEGLGRPAFYELIPGRIQISDVSLEIQEKDLRRQISWENGSLPLSAEKVKKFIEAFRQEVKSLSPDIIDEELEMPSQDETGLLTYGSIPEARWDRVLKRCENDFQQSELKLIRRFIQENKQPNGVLALQVKRKVSVSPR